MKRFPLFGSLFLVTIGAQLWAGLDHRIVAMSAFLSALGSWGLMWHEVARQRTKPYWIALVVAIGIFLALIVAPATSKDFNSYALYGRMVAQYSASPYTHEPVDFTADPWFKRSSYFWTDTPSVYGPVFTGYSAVAMKAAGTSPLGARLAFQGLAAASLLGAVALAARRIGWPRAMVIIGCNPLLLTFGVNDAHCDVLIGLFVLAAALALERRWFVVCGALLACAACVKIAVLPAVGGAFVWIAFRKNIRHLLQYGLGFLVSFVALMFAGGGFDALRPLLDATGRHTRFSLWNPVHQLIAAHTADGIPTHLTADAVVSLCANLVVLVVGVGMILRHRNDTHVAVVIVIGLVTYQLFGAYVLSWYAAWSLPALALAANSRTAVIAMAHGSWVAIAYFSGYGAIAVAVAFLGLAVWRREDVRRFLGNPQKRESLAA